jgi:transcriptional regulator with XRE-family HTH domain
MLTSPEIGKTIKLIRGLRNYSQEWVATQAGYRDKTTYSRFETGKIKNLDFDRFQQICNALNCNTVHVILLASIKTFRNELKTWDEFVSTLAVMDKKDRDDVLELVKEIFPEKHKEIIAQFNDFENVK